MYLILIGGSKIDSREISLFEFRNSINSLQLVILGVAAIDIENEDNWVWFLQELWKDFPGIDVFMADAEKGITSYAFQNNLASISALSSCCARHLAGTVAITSIQCTNHER
jgi:hypothetical protein